MIPNRKERDGDEYSGGTVETAKKGKRGKGERRRKRRAVENALSTPAKGLTVRCMWWRSWLKRR